MPFVLVKDEVMVINCNNLILDYAPQSFDAGNLALQISVLSKGLVVLV